MNSSKRPSFGTVREETPIAQTRTGKVAGENRDGIAIFRGTPYGDRVDRERRFLPAKPAAPWEGVRDCTENGPICVQTEGTLHDFYSTGGHPELLKMENEVQGENCLVLNVLTPGIDKKRRPVLVYIHGGGYSVLSGTHMTLGDRFAREQDVVMVSLNHRLHVFGYLYLGGLDERYRDSGNVGHLDLILALQWVRDNIESFGGDPDCVTLIGESGGSDKIMNLLHMPEARGLFHRALLMSCFLPVGRITPEIADGYTRQLLDTLGIPEKEWQRILDVPAGLLTKKTFDPSTRFSWGTFAPVSDGIHLGKGLGAGYVPAFNNGRIPLILGSSEDEVATFCLDDALDLQPSQLRGKLLKDAWRYGLPVTEENVDRLIETFEKKNRKHDPADHTFFKMVTLKCFMGDARAAADDLADADYCPVYLYTNRLDIPHGDALHRRFAGHCQELMSFWRVVAFPEMEERSVKLSEHLAAFMRTGNPSTAELSWPQYDPKHKLTMEFDRIHQVVSDPYREEHEALDLVCGHHAVVDYQEGDHLKNPIPSHAYDDRI